MATIRVPSQLANLQTAVTTAVSGDTIYIESAYATNTTVSLAAGKSLSFDGDSSAHITLQLAGNTIQLLGDMPFDVVGGPAADVIYGNAGSNFIRRVGSSSQGDKIYAGAGDDIIRIESRGQRSNDILDGGPGVDSMAGDTGDDTYYVDNPGDRVHETSYTWDHGEELTEGGYDTIYTTADYALEAFKPLVAPYSYVGVADIEQLIAVPGSTGLKLVGNGYHNHIVGAAGDDVLDGGGGDDVLEGGDGADTLIGGTQADVLLGGNGDDTYYTDGSETVQEGAGGGYDKVYATRRFEIGAQQQIEELIVNPTATYPGGKLTGNELPNKIVGAAGNDVLSGQAGDDMIDGGGGADSLDGGSGIDRLIGGAGNDTFFVDNAQDEVTENFNDGIDLVYATLDFTLPADVENLYANAGPIGLRLSGNGLANVLQGGTGNDTIDGMAGADAILGGAGDDVLDGGAGADTLNGAAGNDIYVIDDPGDLIQGENGDSTGIDTVRSAVSWVLGKNLENLQLLGSDDVSGTGNALANVLVGNGGNNALSGGAGDDMLDGKAGDDAMRGGAGNDIYLVEDAADVVTETAGEGTDTVETTLSSYTLGANVDNLAFIGAGDFRGTGNALANTLTGGAGNDTLSGMDGNDALVISAASDLAAGELYDGGAGSDTLQFLGAASGVDLSNLRINAVENLSGFSAGVSMTDGQLRTFTGTIDTGDVNLATNGRIDLSLADFRSQTLDLSSAGNNGLTLADNAAISHVVNGGAANDTVTVLGGASGISLFGNGGDDNLAGGGGNDSLNGGAESDALSGGSGADTLTGGGGSDRNFGEDGNDTLAIAAASDLVANELYDGGAGSDTLQFLGAASSVDLSDLRIDAVENLSGFAADVSMTDGQLRTFTGTIDTGDVTLTTSGRVDLSLVDFRSQTLNLSSAGNNGLTLADSAAVSHVVNGGGAVDTITVLGGASGVGLFGFAGNDKLVGGGGADGLDGGAGVDTLTGGAGDDTFAFAAGQANGDKVMDFAGTLDGGHDRLQFAGYDGTAAFTQLSATSWLVSDTTHSETIKFTNGAHIAPADVLFV